MQERPSLQDLVKASMVGSNQKLAVQVEAGRQERQKTASATPPVSRELTGHVATEVCTKLADALGFIERELLKEADYDLGPGKGPGALEVMQATSSETNIDAGQSGQATSKNQPPQTPALQPEQVQQGNAGTGLQTNDSLMLPGYPADGPIKNGSANLEASNRARMSKLSGLKDLGKRAVETVKDHSQGIGTAALGATAAGLGYAGGRLHGIAKAHEGKDKKASVVSLIRKLAEDAINPAQISGSGNIDPVEPPPGASAAGEQVPSEPGDVTSQKRLISSNEAAINYTKGQAKEDPKRDVAQVLTEPPLSAAHDKVLERAFDATGRAGVKISSAGVVKTASSVGQIGATRVLLGRLLKEASAPDPKDGKDKRSTGMAPTTPQSATGANAATMGM
jgi:hypothetical protein